MKFQVRVSALVIGLSDPCYWYGGRICLNLRGHFQFRPIFKDLASFEICMQPVGHKSRVAFCNYSNRGRYINIVLQTIQMQLIFLCVWAEPAVLGSVKTALKFKYEV